MAEARTAVGCAIVAVLLSASAGAQPRAEFEAASIKPNISAESRTFYTGLGASPLSGELVNPLEHISLVNTTLRTVIELAYGIPQTRTYAIVGDPQASVPGRFDIAATVPKGATGKQVMEMLQTLLADRFHLKMHQEVRDVAVFTATVAQPGRLGPQLQPSEIDCLEYRRSGASRDRAAEPLARDGQLLCRRSDSMTNGSITSGSAGTIAGLLTRYQGFFDRPLIDATGLTGSFEWKLTFAARPNAPDAAAPMIRDAFEDQLGLKMAPDTAPIDVWVIDSVTAPDPD